MNTLKSFKYLSVVAMMGIWGCSKKQVTTKGEYDDLYGSSADAPVVTYANTRTSDPYQNPNYLENERYEPRQDYSTNQSNVEGTDQYYDEDYLNTRKVKRTYTSRPGYYDGFDDGYNAGWNDFAWSQPTGWNNPFLSNFGFNYARPWGWNIGFGLGSG
ncbi:MAG: hypothetical protein MUF45_09440, partial [Spirosomaceae bacterium]|nr:hypothetical protein [Spirosomataceae bacterium]